MEKDEATQPPNETMALTGIRTCDYETSEQGGRVVNALASEARGSGFDPRQLKHMEASLYIAGFDNGISRLVFRMHD